MRLHLAFLFACVAALAAEPPPPTLARTTDRIVVAADGSGDFRTVQGAVDFAEAHREKAVVIFIRKGHYEELVRVGRDKQHVHLVGEDRKGTVIAFTNNEKLNPGWIQRSVLGVEGDDFVLENLTVQNTTPYKGSQAEAVYVNAERCVLRNANFSSFQDTLNLSGRVYVADCTIEGDVDYVWGYGTAVFERCELRTMHDGYIVQARNSASRAGYVFLDCKLTTAPDVKTCWLARIETARFPASHVAFIRCAMGPHIPAAGWQITGPVSDTLRFEEFASTDLDDKPLDVSGRELVGKQIAAEQAARYAPAKILVGDDGWKPGK
jgi:pectin methylesterase-like acyl-CoA thioesterase